MTSSINKKYFVMPLVVTVSSLTLLSCSNIQKVPAVPSSTQTTCQSFDTDISCLLGSAWATMQTIDDDFDWVTSATELTIALDSFGDQDKAWSLLSDAVLRLDKFEDNSKMGKAIADIALALKYLHKNDKALPIITELQSRVTTLEDKGVQADINCKLVTAIAVHNDPIVARQLALDLSQTGEPDNAFRGRTQREIVALFAKKGHFQSAITMIDDITSDFSYYKAIAYTDVMSAAAKAGRPDIVEALKAPAVTIANSQTNGYFAAGIHRDIAYSLIMLGNIEEADEFIKKSLEAAKSAPSFQEKARSTSRIASRLSDAGQQGKTPIILERALEFAKQENSDLMQDYSIYEIAGSAAFSGNTAMSNDLVFDLPESPFGNASSLRAAAQRDLAWGMVRSGRTEEGVILASAIAAPREKVHAYSRIIRLLINPTMGALPRYL